MNELMIFNRDEVHKLPKKEREKVIREYHKWLKQVRKTDKKIKKALENRIRHFKNGHTPYLLIRYLISIDGDHFYLYNYINKKGKLIERIGR